MEKKYLLYIDILGFSELVKESEAKVRRLYRIIDSLNVHRHPSFKAIIFSDTILVYNVDDAFFKHDHEYLVMFLIEFAQNLLYQSVGRNYYFRAVLVYGEFEHKSLRNTEQFFGNALIDAYVKQKSVKCTGLFIDNHCHTYNDIFPVERYDKNLSFVYLNQSLEELHRGELGPIPVDADLLYQTDYQWYLAKM